jgi:adenylate cyclase
VAGEQIERRLVAILIADVAGYSRLIGIDDEGTLARLNAHHAELIEPEIKEHRGRIVRTTGDGLLALFVSAVDALRCAVEIQRAMIQRNAQIPPDNRIEFRMGVNVGDIVEGTSIHGDGINVAARLEALAEAGGICVSSRVQEDAQGSLGRLDITFEDIGQHRLKNIDRAVQIYRVLLDRTATTKPKQAPTPASVRESFRHPASVGLRAASPPAGSDLGAQSQSPVLGRPSVAVLPFDNLSGDPQQDYFSDGITEDIITELSRFSELLVIARNSSFQYKGKAVDIRQVGEELGARYVLEGSVRRSDGRVRITAQLIDTMTGAHRWAERYDRELHDAFAVQDEVARTIVAILAAHVNRAEIEKALLKPPANWEAYEYYLRGAEALALHQNRRTKASLYDARRLLEQSLAIDPDYARAAAVLSWTHLNAYLEPFDGDHLSPAALDRALEWAETAVHLDARLPQARYQLGYVLLFKRQHDAAMAEFERAIALNPNFIDYRYARALLFGGEPARAIEVLEAKLRLDPFQPLMYSTSWMGQANYMLKRYGDAARLLREFTSRLPNIQLPHLWLAAACAQLGQLEEAKKETAEVLRINPGFTIESWKRLAAFKDPKDVDHNIDGLRKAGLPET